MEERRQQPSRTAFHSFAKASEQPSHTCTVGQIQQISKPSDGDAPMETVHIEARLTHLEQQFQKVQAMQIGTDHKVGQLQHQLEQQSQALGDRIDEKLNGHMERIEMLLHKRSRHE